MALCSASHKRVRRRDVCAHCTHSTHMYNMYLHICMQIDKPMIYFLVTLSYFILLMLIQVISIPADSYCYDHEASAGVKEPLVARVPQHPQPGKRTWAPKNLSQEGSMFSGIYAYMHIWSTSSCTVPGDKPRKLSEVLAHFRQQGPYFDLGAWDSLSFFTRRLRFRVSRMQLPRRHSRPSLTGQPQLPSNPPSSNLTPLTPLPAPPIPPHPQKSQSQANVPLRGSFATASAPVPQPGIIPRPGPRHPESFFALVLRREWGNDTL